MNVNPVNDLRDALDALTKPVRKMATNDSGIAKVETA